LDWLPQELRRILEWSIELAGGHPEVGEKLRSHLEEIGQRYRYGLGATNSAMQLALQQLLNCPYHGFTKQLYLESKAMELIALRLEQLKEQVLDFNPPSNLPDRLQGDDIDRIHHARDILVDNLDDPPSLLELARQVGLNDYKLKRGFRYCFGTTAFGYLHDYRMEQARQLLLERQMQVNEVARAVGYASRSSFATAFRKKFGVSPKAIAL
jgi:AraC-like DNA-binding protein